MWKQFNKHYICEIIISAKNKFCSMLTKNKKRGNDMESNSNHSPIRLLNYLQKQRGNPFYYQKYGERIHLASEFLFSFNDLCSENNVNSQFAKYAPFLNVETIGITLNNNYDEEDGFSHFIVNYDSCKNISLNEEYHNFTYGSPRTFSKKALFKTINSKNVDVIKSYNEIDAVYTIVRLLFQICFCFHPFKGSKFYNEIDLSVERQKEFFSSDNKFIFDLSNNENRFINGYHELAYDIWQKLTNKQHNLWNDAFLGNIKTINELCDRWHDAYTFYCLNSKTPCGVIIPSLVFDDNNILITAENTIGNKSIYCKYCKDSLISKCESCDVKTKRTTFLTIQLKVSTQFIDSDNQKVTIGKDLFAYDGKSIWWKDPTGSSKDEQLFVVVAAKKANILGLKNKTRKQVFATCGSQSRNYKEAEIIALLPGTIIQIDEKTRLIVPGQPIESAQPNDVKVSSKNNNSHISKTIPNINTSTRAKTPSIAIPSNCIITSKDLLCMVDKTSGRVFEKEGFKKYSVTSKDKNGFYDLWVFSIEVAKQKGFIDNIDQVIQEGFNLRYLLSPLERVEPQGFCKGQYAYISKRIMHKAFPLSSVIDDKTNRFFPLSQKDIVESFLRLFQTLKELESRGYSLRVIKPNNIWLDEEEKRMYFRQVHYLSKDCGQLPKFDDDYSPNEVKRKLFEPDIVSDCYALTALLLDVLIAQNAGDPSKATYPQYVKELFDNTLSKERETNDEKISNEAILKAREKQPSIDRWCKALSKWLKELDK